MPDEVASGWNHLNELLYHGSWKPALGRFRSSFAFRGMADAREDLRTTLARLGSDSARLEGHLLRNFRKYAQRESVRGDSVWNWLAVAQHHGLPTRLLDWTYSPYVALHFATEDPALYGVDGAIWSVDYTAASRRMPEPLRAMLADEGSEVFTAELLERAAHSLTDLEALDERPFVVFLEPPSLDERIINQFALFSLMSSARASLDEWLAAHAGLARRIIVPAKLKWEVRDKLDQANITERVLYPGLDGLSRWLKRYYAPRQED